LDILKHKFFGIFEKQGNHGGIAPTKPLNVCGRGKPPVVALLLKSRITCAS